MRSKADPRRLAIFKVALTGAPGVGKSSLHRALLDAPATTEADLVRFQVDDAPPEPETNAAVLVVRGAPGDNEKASLEALSKQVPSVLVAVHARDLDRAHDDELREAWSTLVAPAMVHLTATPFEAPPLGIELLRASLAELALANVDASAEQVRRSKRPFAIAIVAGAAVAAAVEGLLPGAAAFVVSTQIGAISSLNLLYTGRWMGRTQALTLLPMFASEAAGGSVFLLVKSFLPPTGIADAAAAVVAASITIAMLGSVALALEHGTTLDEKEKLRATFTKLGARTSAERAALLRNRGRFGEKSFWSDLVKRLVFEN